jgi:hypothetical protein
VKRTCCALPLLILLLGGVHLSDAQTSFDLTAGAGITHTHSSGVGLETSTYAPCTPSASDPSCQATPGLGGPFMGLGAALMLSKHFGVGAEANFTPDRRSYFVALYGGLGFRQTFYDFDGIYAPVNEKRFQLRILGGIGGSKTGFAFTSTDCVPGVVCSTSAQPIGSDNHFSAHASVGPQVYLTERIFVRPEFSYYYAPGLSAQFGSNSVLSVMVWVGYTWGAR